MKPRRFCQRGYLKPEKVQEYKELHAAVWPRVKQVIQDCNLRNYSIHIMDNEVIAYFEYVGTNYEADMEKMARDSVTQEWWTHTKPCFVRHAEGIHYVDMEEIFYQE